MRCFVQAMRLIIETFCWKEAETNVFPDEKVDQALGSADGFGAGRNGEAVVFLQPSGSELREIWMADGAGNCRLLGSIDFSDLPDTPFPPEVKDIHITDDDTVFLWYSVYILAKDSGLEEHNDAPEGALYQTDRIYALDADGNISEQTSEETVSWMEGAEPALSWNLEKTTYYIKDNALCKFDDATEESSRVFELASFGILQEEIRDIRVRDGGQIEILFQREGETSYLCMN